MGRIFQTTDEQGVDMDVAGQLVFGDRSEELLDAIKLAKVEIMSYLYHVGEASMDERHWSISSPRILTRAEVTEAFCNADFEIGQKPQTIGLDTGVEVQLYLKVLSSVKTHKLACIMARLQRKNNET